MLVRGDAASGIVSVKLLLDENLSPRAAVELRRDGIDVVHVRERNLLAAADHVVMDRAFDEDRVVVTINCGDFEQLAARRELHPGVMLIEPSGLSRQEQITLLRKAMRALRHGEHHDLVNMVAVVQRGGALFVRPLHAI